MRRILLSVFGLCIAIILSLTWYQSVHAPVELELLEISTITLTDPNGRTVEIEVEVADDNAERMHGLMGREHLPAGQGMVFVFDEPLELSFWMKNTLIPLDILYFDEQGKFVSRTMMSPCVTPVCVAYPSGKPAAFALEVNAGEAKTAAVGDGWMLSIR